MSEQTQCWYCHSPAIEVWHVDGDEHDWPMCSDCISHVRQALAHLAEGCDEAADRLDEQYGICTSTDGMFGQWIPPTQDTESCEASSLSNVAMLAP